MTHFNKKSDKHRGSDEIRKTPQVKNGILIVSQFPIPDVVDVGKTKLHFISVRMDAKNIADALKILKAGYNFQGVIIDASYDHIDELPKVLKMETKVSIMEKATLNKDNYKNFLFSWFGNFGLVFKN